MESNLESSLIGTIREAVDGLDNGDTWKYANVTLPTCSNQFQLVIEGVRSKKKDNSVFN